MEEEQTMTEIQEEDVLKLIASLKSELADKEASSEDQGYRLEDAEALIGELTLKLAYKGMTWLRHRRSARDKARDRRQLKKAREFIIASYGEDKWKEIIDD